MASDVICYDYIDFLILLHIVVLFHFALMNVRWQTFIIKLKLRWLSVGKSDSNFDGLLQLYRYLIVWFCEYFHKLSVRPNDDSSLTTLMTVQKQLSVHGEFKVIAGLNLSSAVSNISYYKLIIIWNIVWNISIIRCILVLFEQPLTIQIVEKTNFWI